MIDKFILTGLTALTGLTWSVYADANAIPTTPIIENVVQQVKTTSARTENQVVAFAVTTAINYLLLIDNTDVDVTPDIPDGINNGDFASGGDFWQDDNATTGITVDYSAGTVLLTDTSSINNGSVWQNFTDDFTLTSGDVTFSYNLVNRTIDPDIGNFNDVGEIQVWHFYDDGGSYSQDEIYQEYISQNETVTSNGVQNISLTLPPLVDPIDYYQVIFTSTGNSVFVELDDFSVKMDVASITPKLNAGFDFRMLMIGVSSYEPSGWNFQRGSDFDNSVKFAFSESQNTRTQRRLNSSRLDSVQFTAKNDSDLDDLLDMVRYQLPSDGLVFWQRDSSSYDFKQCFIAYLQVSKATNKDEQINAIAASFKEVTEWL